MKRTLAAITTIAIAVGLAITGVSTASADDPVAPAVTDVATTASPATADATAVTIAATTPATTATPPTTAAPVDAATPAAAATTPAAAATPADAATPAPAAATGAPAAAEASSASGTASPSAPLSSKSSMKYASTGNAPSNARCLPASAVSYTYKPADNAGTVTVAKSLNEGFTSFLCSPIFITAASWKYTKAAMWPQVLDAAKTQYITVDRVGTYHYQAVVTCGQGDIYARTGSYITPTLTLAGPQSGPNGWEKFLSDLGLNTSPRGNTWVQSPISCVKVLPVASIVAGECYWNSGQAASFKTAKVTYDNRKSNVPVDFSIQGVSTSGQTVKAGESAVVTVPESDTGGSSYTVLAAGTKTTLKVAAYKTCPPVITVTPPTPRSNIVANCTVGGARTDIYVSNDFIPTPSTTGADFVAKVIVNGKLREKIAVPSTKVVSTHYDFPSNTGTYSVEVTVDGKIIAEQVVDSNCALKTEADPSPQDCVDNGLVNGQIHVMLNSNLVYKIDGVIVTDANTTVTPGTHTVTAELANPKGIYRLDGPSSWTFDSAPFAGTCDLPPHSLVAPIASSTVITCDAAGSYTLGATEGVVWTVDGKATPAGTYTVTTTNTVLVVAHTVSSDYGFEKNVQTTWPFKFTEPMDCGQLVPHGLVYPIVTSVDRACSVNGSYTLGAVDGVVYTVNGTVQAAGTYQVSTAKTVNVVASVTSSDFGFEQDVNPVYNLAFTNPTNCGDLTTLAFTGSNGTLAYTGSNGTLAGGLLVGLMFVLLGAGALTVSRVRKSNS